MTDRVLSVNAHPLYWPEGWRRVKHRQPSRYNVSFANARDAMTRELRLLGAQDIVVSTNVPLRHDGLPYARSSAPADPGVAVYWTTRKHGQRVIACDAWRTVRENLRAVGLAIESLRLLERTGASEILDRAFTGFAALPAQGESEPDWWLGELGLDRSELTQHALVHRVRIIMDAYRRLARQRHPDCGGSDAEMVRLNKARDAAMQANR